MAKTNFNNYRFEGLDYKSYSKEYYTMKRVSDEETKIVICVNSPCLLPTKYGWALILDLKHVVFLKDWAVNCTHFGNDVLLQKEYFKVKTWGFHSFCKNEEEALDFQTWVNLAKEQDESYYERVIWKKRQTKEQKKKALLNNISWENPICI